MRIDQMEAAAAAYVKAVTRYQSLEETVDRATREIASLEREIPKLRAAAACGSQWQEAGK